jgi:hypothetical protein
MHTLEMPLGDLEAHHPIGDVLLGDIDEHGAVPRVLISLLDGVRRGLYGRERSIGTEEGIHRTLNVDGREKMGPKDDELADLEAVLVR